MSLDIFTGLAIIIGGLALALFVALYFDVDNEIKKE